MCRYYYYDRITGMRNLCESISIEIELFVFRSYKMYLHIIFGRSVEQNLKYYYINCLQFYLIWYIFFINDL